MNKIWNSGERPSASWESIAFNLDSDTEGHSTMALWQSKQNAKRDTVQVVQHQMYVLVKQLTFFIKWLLDDSCHE